MEEQVEPQILDSHGGPIILSVLEGRISNPECASHSSSSNAMGSVPEYGISYEGPLDLGGAPNNASLPHDHGELFPRSASDGQLHHQYRTHPAYTPIMPGYYYYVCDGKVYVPASPPQPVSSLYAGQDANPNFPSHPGSY
eukprot:scaffold136434_cov69-Attheya_sp.AAC.2